MLLSLSIRDFVIVDRLELSFAEGFTVLTGETGAGKSLLIDALSLLLGGRFEAGMVRSNKDRADLQAEFDVSGLPEVQQWLADNQLEGDTTSQLILRRTLDKQGKSRAFINGTVCTLQQLKEVGEWLVDIHGQHAHQSLLRLDVQRQLVDAYGGYTDKVRQVSSLYQTWKQLEKNHHDAEANQSRQEEILAQLDWQISELKPVAVPPEAWLQLQQDHARLSHASTLESTANDGLELLQDANHAAIPLLSHYLDRIKDLVSVDPALAEPAELIESAVIQLQEASYSLRHYAGRQELDPDALQRLDQQLGDIYTLARKFRVSPDALYATLQTAQENRLKIAAQVDIAALAAEVARAKATYLQAARQLTEKRSKTAEDLSHVVTTTLAELAMANTRFEVHLLPLETPGSAGLEQIEYRISHHGAQAQSLAKIASGGELSRVSLAIQVAMSSIASVPTLIFDEVDVGIGGRVADIVGRLLRNLGQKHQVLSITHLPQVAAKGHTHWQVSKAFEDDAIVSRIHALCDNSRIEEIARMLGGATITETTRQHARELLLVDDAANPA